MSDIFLSYASADRSRVKPLVDALGNRGWSVWWDRTILAGKTWDRVIERALADAKCVIVLWSQASVQSDWVRTEADEGKRRGILVPAMLDDISIPLAYRRIQAANLIDWTGALSSEGFIELVRAVSEVLSLSSGAESVATTPPAKLRSTSREAAPREQNIQERGLVSEQADASRETGQARNRSAIETEVPKDSEQGRLSEATQEPQLVAAAQHGRASMLGVRSPNMFRTRMMLVGLLAVALAGIVLYVQASKKPHDGAPGSTQTASPTLGAANQVRNAENNGPAPGLTTETSPASEVSDQAANAKDDRPASGLTTATAPLSGAADQAPKDSKTRVKWFEDAKRFGFINDQGGQDDLFAPAPKLSDGTQTSGARRPVTTTPSK